MIKIRKASKKDINEIAWLMLDEFSKPPFKEKASINAVIKSLNFYFRIGRIHVAIIDKNIAGVIVFKIEQYWEGPVMIIEDLAVKEEFKSVGAGKKLMSKAEAYAKKNKLKSVLFKTHKKSSAVKFYQKIGYKIQKNAVFMEKKIK